jgi:hypothetical protein
MHFAVRLALREKLKRKARLRRKRAHPAPVQTFPPEPAFSVSSQYRASLRLLGEDALQLPQKWKARGHCTYDDVVERLPPNRHLSAPEIENLIAMFASLAIELREDPALKPNDDGLLTGKRILVLHCDVGIRWWIADTLEEEGAQTLLPHMQVDSVLRCIHETALDGAVLNFISSQLPILRIANRLHARAIPIVFYTAFDETHVTRATAHMNRAIVPNPGLAKDIASALAGLIAGKPKRRLRSFLDN